MQPLSFLELAILAMIRQRARSGYDVRKELVSNPVGRSSGSPGAIYPALKKLELQGVIAGKVENPGSLRPRTVYRITPRGRKTLEAHLLQPVTRKDVLWRMDDLMLRFVHAEDVVGLKDSLKIAEELRREIKGLAAEMEGFYRQVRDQVSLTARLALKCSVDTYATQEKWATNAVRQLKNKLRGITCKQESQSARP